MPFIVLSFVGIKFSILFQNSFRLGNSKAGFVLLIWLNGYSPPIIYCHITDLIFP